MRLHEAMRAGAMLRPQGFGQLYVRPPLFRRFLAAIGLGPVITQEDNGSCALGAAIEAAGVQFEPATGECQLLTRRGPAAPYAAIVSMEWYLVLRSVDPCPVCGESKRISELIPHINDAHRWTRTEIADWLEPIEMPQPTLAHVQPAAR